MMIDKCANRKVPFSRLLQFSITSIFIFLSASTVAVGESEYRIQTGDILQVVVWREPDFQQEMLVRPDGGFSMPLIGEINAAGKTFPELSAEVAQLLQKFVPDAQVTITAKQLSGNKIYVLGKVNRPGEFTLNRNVDVMQALSMAGGTDRFAALDDILILRRADGSQTALPFSYSDIEKGRDLAQNIVLQSGDVIVVP